MNWVQPFMFLTICTLQLYNAHKHECLINVKRLKRGIAFFDTFTHLKICEHLMHEICASKVCYVKCVCASYRLPQRHTMVTQLWHLLIICAFTYFMFYLKLQLLWIKSILLVLNPDFVSKSWSRRISKVVCRKLSKLEHGKNPGPWRTLEGILER